MVEKASLWEKLAIGTFVSLLLLSIPFGIGMAFYTDDYRWLWFCMTLIVFMS